jgi:hypothetical protein
MSGQRARLTMQQEHFVKLVVEEGLSLVGAYRISYPPRQGQRSAQGEWVAAKLLAHRPLVEQRMEELREELRAGDPVELRRRANAVLGRILEQRLDPRYRRTALDVLRYLDAQEREVEKREQEAFRTAVSALDAIDGKGPRRRRVPTSPPAIKIHPEQTTAAPMDGPTNGNSRPPTPSEPLQTQTDPLLEEHRRLRPGTEFGSLPSIETDAQPDDLGKAAEIEIPEKGRKEQWVRRPGHFGKGGWMRTPDAP